MVFTPTYYGVSSDVRGLADVAHAHDVPLITDDAWGLKARRPNRLVAAVAGVELTQSTSASPLLLSSIDAARRQFQEYGEELLGHAIDLAHRVRDAVAELPGLELMGDEVLDSPALTL
jgi:arginine/lysine/ornithine decarboxylase